MSVPSWCAGRRARSGAGPTGPGWSWPALTMRGPRMPPSRESLTCRRSRWPSSGAGLPGCGWQGWTITSRSAGRRRNWCWRMPSGQGWSCGRGRRRPPSSWRCGRGSCWPARREAGRISRSPPAARRPGPGRRLGRVAPAERHLARARRPGAAADERAPRPGAVHDGAEPGRRGSLLPRPGSARARSGPSSPLAPGQGNQPGRAGIDLVRRGTRELTIPREPSNSGPEHELDAETLADNDPFGPHQADPVG